VVLCSDPHAVSPFSSFCMQGKPQDDGSDSGSGSSSGSDHSNNGISRNSSSNNSSRNSSKNQPRARITTTLLAALFCCCLMLLHSERNERWVRLTARNASNSTTTTSNESNFFLLLSRFASLRFVCSKSHTVATVEKAIGAVTAVVVAATTAVAVACPNNTTCLFVCMVLVANSFTSYLANSFTSVSNPRASPADSFTFWLAPTRNPLASPADSFTPRFLSTESVTPRARFSNLQAQPFAK